MKRLGRKRPHQRLIAGPIRKPRCVGKLNLLCRRRLIPEGSLIWVRLRTSRARIWITCLRMTNHGRGKAWWLDCWRWYWSWVWGTCGGTVTCRGRRRRVPAQRTPPSRWSRRPMARDQTSPEVRDQLHHLHQLKRRRPAVGHPRRWSPHRRHHPRLRPVRHRLSRPEPVPPRRRDQRLTERPLLQPRPQRVRPIQNRACREKRQPRLQIRLLPLPRREIKRRRQRQLRQHQRQLLCPPLQNQNQK